MRVYDLAGRVVRQFDAVQVQNGRSELRWDGKGDGGQQLPPGTYIVQVEIRSDSSTESRAHSVVIAY